MTGQGAMFGPARSGSGSRSGRQTATGCTTNIFKYIYIYIYTVKNGINETVHA